MEVANLPEVPLHLLHFSYLLDHVLTPDTVLIELCDDVGGELPELLRSERKHGQLIWRDTHVDEVVFGPPDQLQSVHARHFVIDNYQCDTVRFLLIVQRSDGLSNLKPVLEELSVVFEFHLVVENVLKCDLIENGVFIQKDLSLQNYAAYCALTLGLILELHLLHRIEISSNLHVEACFAK